MKKRRYERAGKCNRCGKCCMNEDCEYFKIEENIATCLIHNDPNRPLKCVIYPYGPPIIFDTCGYYFIDTLDNNKIIRMGLR